MATTKVTSGGITDATITTADIADASITAAKLGSGVQKTITKQADNRVITASGTANTLNAESNVHIDGSGRLLIGTTDVGSSGVDTLIVNKSGNGGLTIRNGTNNNGNIYFSDGTSGAAEYAGYLQYQHAQDTLAIGTSGSERMRVDSSGKIGIGTTSPDQTVHVHKGSAGSIDSTANSVLTLENSTDAILQFLSPSSNVNQIRFGDPSDNGAGFIDYDHNTNRLAFGTAGPERMRLDSSGQLLIGGTTLGASGSFGIEPNGHVRSVLASGTTGDTLFGAISGVSNGFQVGISGTNVQRYSFHNGSTVTARIDSDGLKFMNDTAAANALDDYETGTAFTSTGNATVYHATYVKVGNIVNIVFRLNVTSGGQTLGLPFAAASGDIHLGTSTNFYLNASTLTFPAGFHKGTGTYHTS